MNCLYCGGTVAPSRDLSEPEFCSSDHRLHYRSGARLQRCEHQFTLAGPGLASSKEIPPSVASRLAGASPAIMLTAIGLNPALRLSVTRSEALQSLLGAWPFEAVRTVSGTPMTGAVPIPAGPLRVPKANLSPGRSVLDLSGFAILRHRFRTTWARMPRPLLVSVAVLPVLWIASGHGRGVQSVVETQWSGIGAQVQQRAGVAVAEDFRNGLGQWRGRSNSKPAWSFDGAGFVHPGALALLRPTVDLTDYRLEFTGQIDRRGLGFVFRAKDFNNYYAVKLVIAEPGPLPRVNIVRYAVIRGREGPRITRSLPLTVREETWYAVSLDVKKTDFALTIQGQVADYWSDDRLTGGGVGFYCGKGEDARLRSVAVSHQNDTLGKFFAYLKPHGGAGK